jgi:hypothetical protein
MYNPNPIIDSDRWSIMTILGHSALVSTPCVVGYRRKAVAGNSSAGKQGGQKPEHVSFHHINRDATLQEDLNGQFFCEGVGSLFQALFLSMDDQRWLDVCGIWDRSHRNRGKIGQTKRQIDTDLI